MESVEGLLDLLAAVFAKQKFREILESVFASTPEFKVLKSLCEAGRPMFLTELARSNGLGRSPIVSYTKGSRRYEGEIRAALDGLLERSIVVADESSGKTRYKLNVSNINALLLGEVMAPRRALSG